VLRVANEHPDPTLPSEAISRHPDEEINCLLGPQTRVLDRVRDELGHKEADVIGEGGREPADEIVDAISRQAGRGRIGSQRHLDLRGRHHS
jgi:hypothetical protein